MNSSQERKVRPVFAITNQKGGVGKTTTALNLGAALASQGKPCLLIDMDPQANATAGLGAERGHSPNIYDAIGGGALLGDTIVETPQPGLSLIPSAPDLAGAEVELVSLMAREQRLSQALDALEAEFSAVIIDCPPSLGLLTLNALTAAVHVLVPVQCEYLALEGLGQLSATLEAVRSALNRKLNLGGLLLTMYDSRTKLCRDVAAEVRSHFPSTFKTVIPRSVRLSEAPSHGLPINLYAGSSSAAKAYNAFADEVATKFSLTTPKLEVGP